MKHPVNSIVMPPTPLFFMVVLHLIQPVQRKTRVTVTVNVLAYVGYSVNLYTYRHTFILNSKKAKMHKTLINSNDLLFIKVFMGWRLM